MCVCAKHQYEQVSLLQGCLVLGPRETNLALDTRSGGSSPRWAPRHMWRAWGNVGRAWGSVWCAWGSVWCAWGSVEARLQQVAASHCTLLTWPLWRAIGGPRHCSSHSWHAWWYTSVLDNALACVHCFCCLRCLWLGCCGSVGLLRSGRAMRPCCVAVAVCAGHNATWSVWCRL